MKKLSRRRHPRLPATAFLLAGLAFLVSACRGTVAEGPATTAASSTSKPVRDWPMLGGGPSRNPVNTTAKNVPIEWSIKDGAQKNVKWSVPISKPAYGGPVIAGGKIFIGTSNSNPRNPNI